jgi:hypothetical protein
MMQSTKIYLDFLSYRACMRRVGVPFRVVLTFAEYRADWLHFSSGD